MTTATRLMPDNRRPWWETAASIVAAIPGIAFVVLLVLYLSGIGFKTDQNKSDLVQVKTDLAGRIEDLKKTVTDGQDAVQRQIQNLPVDQAELNQHDREIEAMKSDFSAWKDRVQSLQGDVGILRTRVDNIASASSQQLMPGRR